jgi:hypothetical protein
MLMRSFLGIAIIVPLVGCAVGNTDAPDAEAQTSTTAAAVVVVERSGGGDAVVARFVRARQGVLDDVSLRAAGVQELPAAGTCVTTFDPPASLGGARSVDLLDVGAVSVDRTMLLPRTMPDPAGMVSGYFYSARSADVYAPAQRLSVRASGGQDLPDGFAVNVGTPRDLSEIRVATTAAGLDVGWDESDARDIVYVDVVADGNIVTRCTTLDIGHLTVPSFADEGSLSVHRIHREAFKTRGIDPGEVRFDFSRIVAFHR